MQLRKAIILATKKNKKNSDWKRANKPPACTKNPLYNYIPANIRHKVLNQIKRDCIEHIGHDLDSCPKRKVCFGKSCIGRPLPTFSEAAKPYIDKLKETQKVIDGELFIKGCDLCPIAQTCDNPCLQVVDSAKRNQSKEPILYYKETVENYEVEEEIYQVSENNLRELGWEIPWDILTERKRKIVKAYLDRDNPRVYTEKLARLSLDLAFKYWYKWERLKSDPPRLEDGANL